MNLLASFQTAYIVDIVAALVLVVGMLSGAKKGFVKSFFGMISTIAALILAFSLASTVSGLINSAWEMNGFFSGKLETAFSKIKGFDTDISGEGIAAALENVALPGFIKDLLLKNVESMNELPAGTTLASQVAPVVAQFVGLLISGIIIFILAKILLLIIEKILSSIVRSWSIASALNTLLGLAVGLLKAAVIVCGILAVLSLIPSEGITKFFDNTFFLKYLYNDNPLTKLLGLFIKF